MKANKRGFTLMEVLVALVILAIAFTTIMVSLSTSAQRLISLQNKTAAQWVGMNVIARVQTNLLPAPDESGSTNGTDSMFDSNWNWVLGVNSTDDRYVQRLTVDVGKEGENGNLVHLNGYLFKGPS